MATHSRTLDIIKKLGDATPPPIRLSRLLQSPIQGFFSFAVSNDNRPIVVRIFEQFAEASINLRFISEHLGAHAEVRIQFCCDNEVQAEVLTVFKEARAFETFEEFRHVDATVILSLHPFNGQPQFVERVFSVLRQQGIKVLCANTATSVLSCVVSVQDLESVIRTLRQVFIWQ